MEDLRKRKSENITQNYSSDDGSASSREKDLKMIKKQTKKSYELYKSKESRKRSQEALS